MLALYGSTPAKDFGPLAMKAVRQKMIEADSRRTTDQRPDEGYGTFQAGRGEQLIPPSVHQSCVRLWTQRGRTEGPREPEPVGPVDDATVKPPCPTSIVTFAAWFSSSG